MKLTTERLDHDAVLYGGEHLGGGDGISALRHEHLGA